MTDPDQPASAAPFAAWLRRPPVAVLVPGAVAVVAAAAAGVAAARGATASVVGACIAGALIAGGLAAIALAHAVVPGDPDIEERKQKGPDRRRRRLILGVGAGAVALTAGVAAVPAARRVELATRRLRATSWRDGLRVVDADGTPVRPEGLVEGEMLTVYPEGHVGVIDSQAVLIHEVPERFRLDAARRDWAPDGVVVYSKLCTHMGCPLGLYQQEFGTLLCPCHQAVFDVLDGGQPLQGPAPRPLPQLPVRIGDDGILVARGDFSDAVGTGFWGRQR